MAKLVIKGTNRCYSLTEQDIVIGRSSQCDIAIDDEKSSRRHCKIGQNETGYYLQDLHSHNGTIVNGAKVLFHSLKSEDKIKIGKTVINFVLEADDISETFEGRFVDVPILQILQQNKLVKALPLESGSYFLGRSSSCDVCLRDSQVSSKHAEIFLQDGKWWVKDLQSKNGIYINNKKSEISCLLVGDAIRLGQYLCVYTIPGAKPPSPKSKFIYVPLFSITIAALLLLLLFGVQKAFWQSKQIILPVKGNLIDDFSFEEGLSWQLHGGMRFFAGVAKRGKSSLYFSSAENNSQRESFHEAHYWEPIPVNYGKVYQVSLWMKFQDLHGAAGVKLRWFDEHRQKLPIQSYSPLMAGNSRGWQQISFIAYPPPEARQIKLFCFVVGKGRIYFDDIIVLEAKQNQVPQAPSLTYDRVQARMDSRGVLHVYHQNKILLSSAKILIWDKQHSKLIASQAFAAGELDKSANSLIWKGSFSALDASKRLFTFHIECVQESDGLVVDISPISNYADISLEYALTLPRKYLQHKLRLGTSEKSTYYHRFNKAIQCDLQYAIWELPRSKIGFFYPQATNCTISANEEGLSINHRLPKSATLTFKIRSDLLKEMHLLEKWQGLAQQYERTEWGQAALYYEKIVEHFTFQQAAETAQQRLQEIHKIFARERTQLLEMWNQARFFQSLPKYRQLQVLCNKIQSQWRGFPPLAKLSKTIAEVKQEIVELENSEQEKAARILSERGRSLYNEKQYALARLFYQEIVDLYPQTSFYKVAKEKTVELTNKLRPILHR